MQWDVRLKRKTAKGIESLPPKVRATLDFLRADIAARGPVRGDWPNYSALGGGRHHCHLKKGHPTYVAVWRVVAERTVEIIYAGTHESAPY